MVPLALDEMRELLSNEERYQNKSSHIDALSEPLGTINYVIEVTYPMKNDLFLASWECMECSKFFSLFL